MRSSFSVTSRIPTRLTGFIRNLNGFYSLPPGSLHDTLPPGFAFHIHLLLWACIIAFGVFVYVVLDGFDLGIGILFPVGTRP